MSSELTFKDHHDFKTGKGRVLALMSDHRWHSAEEIRQAANGSEGLRRLRELRNGGHHVEKRRLSPKSRTYYYRLIPTASG